jgi:hypothetical protein
VRAFSKLSRSCCRQPSARASGSYIALLKLERAAALALDASSRIDSIAYTSCSNSRVSEFLPQRQHLRRQPRLLSLRFRDTRADIVKLGMVRAGGVKTVSDTTRTVLLSAHHRSVIFRQPKKASSSNRFHHRLDL